jgi:hypothetical protein
MTDAEINAVLDQMRAILGRPLPNHNDAEIQALGDLYTKLPPYIQKVLLGQLRAARGA